MLSYTYIYTLNVYKYLWYNQYHEYFMAQVYVFDKIFLSSYSRESFFMISSQKLFPQNIKTLLFQSIFINFFFLYHP
jgi:hypothetical protein